MNDRNFGYKKAIHVLYRFINKYKLILFISSLATIVLIGINLIKAEVIKYLINNALNFNSNEFLKYLVYFGFIVLVGAGISYFVVYYSKKLFAYVIKDIKSILAQHIINLRYPEIQKLQAGDLSSRLNNDTMLLEGFLKNNLTSLISQILMFVFALIYVFFIDWRLVLISFSLTPPLMVAAFYLNKKARHYYPKILRKKGDSVSIIEQQLKGMDIIKTYQLKDFMFKKMDRRLDDVLKDEISAQKYISVLQPVCFMLSYIPRIILIFFGGYLIINGELDTGTIVSVLYLFDFIVGPTVYFPFMLNNLNLATSSLERIEEILELPVEDEKRLLLNRRESGSSITFDNVSFSYNCDTDVLNNISFKVLPNEMTALVGESGSGKSTIFNLIVNLYQNYTGSIKIYNQDLNEVNIHSLRDVIPYVSQDVYLFSGSILENIALGKEGATKEEIIRASKKSHCHEFITNFKDGYETMIGTGGVQLSGGQRQRLALAQALLKDAPMMIFDEPTSALDPYSEKVIKDAIDELSKSKTIFIITHKIDLIKHATSILVLKEGQLIESGNHETLIKKDGYYAELYKRGELNG